MWVLPQPRRIPWILALLLLLGGCHYQAEIVIERNGSGHGQVVITDPPPGVTVADVGRQLGINGFHVVQVTQPSLETMVADVSWQDFEKPFRRRIVNADHSVTLDFGPIDQGQLIVHVPGRIDVEDTTGTVSGTDTALFHPGRARVTYLPSPRWILVLIAVVTLVLIGAVVLAVRLSVKRGV